MSGSRVFVDTNVLVYLHDSDAGEKREQAMRSVRELWESGAGTLSTQVMQEFYVTVTRKIEQPISRLDARSVIDAYRAWEVVTLDAEDVLAASEIEERHRIAFWDALIVRAAVKAGCAVLLTEDLNHGQVIEGVRVKDPFRVEQAT